MIKLTIEENGNKVEVEFKTEKAFHRAVVHFGNYFKHYTLASFFETSLKYITERNNDVD